MAKKFKSGKCIHCLIDYDELTSDHVFPDAWYPDSTPPNIEKWQAPSCPKCNSNHGKNENDLLQLIGLCLNPSEIKACGISKKALRAINPGRNHKDSQHRLQRKQRTLRKLIPSEKIPVESLYPSFGIRDETASEHLPGVLVPKDGLEMLAEKIVRGLTYVLDHKLVESDHVVSVLFLRPPDDEQFINLLNTFGSEYHCGPGIKIRRGTCADDPVCGVYEIEIWGKLKMYATVELASNSNIEPLE